MTFTSDERREVAARLRTEVGENECIIDYAVFRIINDALLINDAWGAKATRILADLIDPEKEGTCHDVRQGGGWFICSRCGALLADGAVTNATSAIRPRYCPNCGARLVGE